MAATTAVTTAAIAAMPPSCTPHHPLDQTGLKVADALSEVCLCRQGVQPTLYVANPLFQCRQSRRPPSSPSTGDPSMLQPPGNVERPWQVQPGSFSHQEGIACRTGPGLRHPERWHTPSIAVRLRYPPSATRSLSQRVARESRVESAFQTRLHRRGAAALSDGVEALRLEVGVVGQGESGAVLLHHDEAHAVDEAELPPVPPAQ